MSYLDSGFNENLIRAGYVAPESEMIDSVNSGEIIAGGGVPTQEITNALTLAEIIDSSKNVIRELINSKLNTQSAKILASFEFGASGAIQIGEYEAGVSGDVKLSPAGFVARNKDNVTTFAIDGDTGDATFLGQVAAGSIIAGDISAATGTFENAIYVGTNKIIIDGASDDYGFKLKDSSNRVIIFLGEDGS